MRILYAVTAAGYGGAPHHVCQLVRHARAAGHEVGVVCAPESRVLEQVSAAGARTFVDPFFVLEMRPLLDALSVVPVLAAVRAFRPDIIHAHSTKAGIAARIAGALARHRRVVFTAHGWGFAEGHAGHQARLVATAERLLAPVTAKIICVSSYDLRLAYDLRMAAPSRLAMIHYGIDAGGYPVSGVEGLRRTLSPDGELVVTMVARMAPQKDHQALLRACASWEHCRVVLVGDGPLRRSLEEMVRANGLGQKVVFLGERRDVPAILSASDVFALPTNWEGLPITILEAMAAGLPVVASAVAGIPEEVVDGVTGYVVPRGDSVKLAEAVSKLLDDRELRLGFGRAGRARVDREFSLTRMLADTTAIYESLMGQSVH